ncbi:uncharacterized protein LOC144112404 [Amblyomma americanum]
MDCSQSPSETSASVRRAGEPAAVSGEPVSKGYVQSRSSQSLLLFQKDADGASPTGSTLNQACSHASGFIMVQSDHTYAGPSTEASASSLEPGTAGVAATLSASADLSPGAPFSSSPLSCEGSFTSPINERRPLQKLRAKLRQLRNRNKRLQGLLLQRRRMKTTAELMEYYPKIVTLRRNGTGFSVLPLITGRCSVGGAAGCDIRIPRSGAYCCLFLVGKNEQAHIINCSGTPDLKLNGKDVHDHSVLSHGDIVQISYRKFRFDYGEKRKKENSSKVAAASHQPKAAGDATPTSNNKRKKASTEQAGAVACEEGDDEEEVVLLQSARDISQSCQESLEHMSVVAESPKVTVSKQTFQYSSQILEISRESAPEKATLPTRSGRSSQTSSNEGKLKVQEKEKEATVGSNQKPSSKPSKAKRTPASKRATAADVTTELEKAGMSASKNLAFDNTDVTAAAFGRATRAARPKYVGTDKRTDVKMPRQEAKRTVSPLKTLEAEQRPASNKELGETPKQEAADTKKSSRKILQAKTARSTRKVNEGEEAPELGTAGVSPSKCSSATNVHVLDEPARPTRGCRTRGSRKDIVEAPKEKKVDQLQSTKATRAEHTQGSRKVCKEGETLQDVTGSSLVMASTTQRKDGTFDKHLQGEASPTKEVSVTRNTRAKRKVDLKEESIAEKHTTAEDLIGTVAEKSGGHQQRVASGEYAPQENDVQCSNSAKQVINPKITRDKEVVDDAPASPNVEVATVEPASAGGKALATTMEPKRSKRTMAAVKVDVAQTANEATPRKTRGRRAEALKTALEWADDKPGASRRTAKDRSEEEPPPKRTRKMV